MEHKRYRLNLKTVKQESQDDQKFGRFVGLASTFQVDSDGDQMMPGTFTKALQKLSDDGKSQVQMKFMHFRSEIIGGFPTGKAFEDVNGFMVEGQINLDVQRGREAFSLMKQGVITDMSIGFFIKSANVDNENQTREINEIDLVEISLVDLPANPGANILEVKTVTPFLDLPLADQERIKRNVNRYFRKMTLDPSFDVKSLDISSVKSLRDVNDLLKDVGISNKDANKIISIVKSGSGRDDLGIDEQAILSKMDNILIDLKLNETISKVG